MTAKAKAAGVGAGLLVGALLVRVLRVRRRWSRRRCSAFALILPAWLSAIIVGVILIVIAVVVGLIGLRSLKKGHAAGAGRPRQELSADVKALKGEQP